MALQSTDLIIVERSGVAYKATAADMHSGVLPVGYGTGAGGTVTQLTSKATAVTLNKLTGEITMNAAALAAATIVSFTINNSTAAVGDQIIATHHAVGTFGAYGIAARVTSAGVITVSVRNNSAASLSEAIVLKVTVFKAATA
jgi:hypothetical protein